MTTIALVTGHPSGTAFTGMVNTKDMLERKGHVVTQFLEGAVTAGNLATFGLIYLLRISESETTLAGHLRAYMRTNNIPVIIGPHQPDDAVFPDTSSDSMLTLLGLAQESTISNVTESPTDIVMEPGFDDVQDTAGINDVFRKHIGQATTTIGTVPKLKFHRGTKLAENAALDTLCFTVLSTERSIFDQITFGADVLYVGWGDGRDEHGREGAAIIEAFIQKAVVSATFDNPTTGIQLALSQEQDLTRLVSYQDSALDWTETLPSGTTITPETSVDDRHVTFVATTKGGEISGLDSEVFTTNFAVDANDLSITSHPFTAADRVRLTTTGTLPAGLALDTDYFVLDISANVINVELSVGGGAVSFTDDGSGTHTVADASGANANDSAVIKLVFASSVAVNTPEAEVVNLVTEGNSPALRQLGGVGAADVNALVLAEDGWYDYGLLVWLTGLNEGITMDAKKWVNGTRTLTLFEAMPFPIAVGDQLTIYPGCDKASTLCVSKFNNINNFRGEPFVPGTDQLFRFPDAPSG